jgi:hypothetical protein
MGENRESFLQIADNYLTARLTRHLIVLYQKIWDCRLQKELFLRPFMFKILFFIRHQVRLFFVAKSLIGSISYISHI